MVRPSGPFPHDAGSPVPYHLPTMPVRFVLGPAGSGKTHRCLELLRAREREGRPGILLVPEQSTHSAERELLDDPALPGLRHVQVLSFTRLAFRLREEAGVPEPPRIGEAVRTMLLRAVLARLPDQTLGPLASLRARQGFLEELGRFVGEVRAHGTLEFLDVVRNAGPGKLRALGAVLEAYDAARRELGLVDPEAALHGLEPLIAEQAGRLRVTQWCVDGFLSWTRREREVLAALARCGAPMEIALCLETGERAPFLPAQRTLSRMRKLLAANGVGEEPPLELPARDVGRGRFARTELATLERRLHVEEDAFRAEPAARTAPIEPTGSGVPAGFPDFPSVQVALAQDPRREVRFWARTIDRWIRLAPAPVPPESVAVILRSVEPYRETIRETFAEYGIPYFLDEPHQLLAHPQARLVLEALEVLLSGWRREAVIGFLRNPLLRCEPAAIDLLENASLEYGRDFAEAWLAESWEPFPPGTRARFARRDDDGVAGAEPEDGDTEPDGDLNAEEENADELAGRDRKSDEAKDSGPSRAAAILAIADEVRRGALLPLRRFEAAWSAGCPDGATASARLRDLESQLLDPDRPGARAAAWEDPQPEWTRRVASALGELLEEAARLWPLVSVSLEEFSRAVRQGIAAARVPAVPVRFGQVMVAEVQRSRLSGIRRAIVGGLNDGEFPRTVAAESILDEQERGELERAGLALGPTAAARQEEETWFAYVALTRASEEVLLTCSRRDAAGKGLEPSLLIAEVRRVLPGIEEMPVAAGTEALAPAELQTPVEAADRLSSRGASPDPVLEELHCALAQPATDSLVRVRARFDRILPALDYRAAETLPEALVERAVPGPTFETGVSRLAEFVQCPYLGFARGVLRLRRRPRAEVTPLETGTLAHSALEEFFRRPAVVSPADIGTRLAEVFQDLRGRREFRAFEVDRASAYRWDSTRRSLERFLRVETLRLQNAGYRIAVREVRFDSGIGNPVTIPLERGRTLLLAGRIDRIDTRVRGTDTLAAVIDYKRSARAGVPKDIARGLDLQLVAYFLFAREVMHWIPVAGLYVPVLPAPVAEEKLEREGPNALKLRAAGLFVTGEREAIDGRTDLLVDPKRRTDQAVPSEAALDSVIDAGKEFLGSYASSLLRGWIPARPLELKPGVLPCDNCDYGSLCRFRPGRDPVRHEPAEGMPVVPSVCSTFPAPESPESPPARSERP